jgi:GTP-binding protein
MSGPIHSRSRGSLVAWETGSSTTFGLENAEGRGVLFVGPGVDIYGGMVVGENQRPGDLEVNVCKRKQLNNMRQAFRDVDGRLTPPREMSLDEAIEYLADDELLEVTPKNLRIRKRILDKNQRARENKRTKQAMGV